MRRLLTAVYTLAAFAVPALAQTVELATYVNPSWSPDGRTIVFEANRDGKYAIYSIGVDGSNLRRLTSAQSNDVQPRFSPDGKLIVFASDRDGRDQVYLMNTDGSGQRRLFSDVTPRKDFYPSFSPDGRWITFGGQHLQRKSLYSAHVVRTDGTGYRALSDTTASAEAPHWSRNTGRVVFLSVPLVERRPGEAPRDFLARRDSASRLVSVGTDGGDPQPAKSEPDETFIAPNYESRLSLRPGPRGAIYVVDWATGAARLLVGTPP